MAIGKKDIELAAGVLALAAAAIGLTKGVRVWGFVHNAAPVCLNGRKGFIIWDYIIWNQLTFISENGEIVQALFSSMSDEETTSRFNEFVAQFGEKSAPSVVG